MRGIIAVLICLAGFAAKGQRQTTGTANEFSLSISHAHLGSGVEGGDKKWLILPSFGFDYTYRFGQWYTGIHSDIIIRNFTVEANLDGDEVFLDRSTPIASAIVIGFNVDDNLSFLLGGGAEFAGEGTYGLVRAGVKYHWELSPKWKVGLKLNYDAKLERYDTWTFGASATRIFSNQ
jgi:hypothetical protein